MSWYSLPTGKGSAVDPSEPVILAPSRRFRRWCTVWSALAVAAMAISLWLGSVVYSPATAMLVSTETFLAIYPIVLMRSRLAVTSEGFQMRWLRSAAGPRIPWTSVTAVERRRGFLLDKVQITADRPQVPFAPIRFRHHDDPDFDAALAELARRSGCEVRPTVRRPHLPLVATLTVLWTGCMAVLTAMYAPWNDPAWPWRHDADRVPGACTSFAATARSLLPSAHRTPDADLFLLGPIRAQDGCTWRSGTVHTFSIGFGLTRKAPFRSADATAHDGFRRTVTAARHPGRTAVPVSGLGDEARELTDATASTEPTAVDVIARRANVIVAVRLITDRPAPDAARTVERIARAALARVTFD